VPAIATRIVVTQQDWKLASSTPAKQSHASVSNQWAHLHMHLHLDFCEEWNPLNTRSKYSEDNIFVENELPR